MALDPRIALAGRPGQFSLQDFATGMQQGQQFRAVQLELSEAERAAQEAEAIRQAYAQQYGGGGAPPGLAGAQPMQPPGPEAPVQERQLGGSPSANAPYATPPPGGPQAPQTMGLAGVQPMTPADQQSQRGFIDKLYTISPKAGREAETHAFTSQKQQYEANKERVEYLGRIANGVLDSPNPQQAWTVARAMLIEAGMPPGQVPEVVDLNYVQQLSGMALDAKDKYNAGILRLQQDKEQRERNQLASKAPDYGYGQDLDAALYARYGTQIPPGSAPTPAMVQQARQDLIAEKRREDQEKQQGRIDVAAATGSSQIVQTPQGYVRVNPRTGAVEQVQGPSGALQPRPTEAEHRAQSLGERASRAHESATRLEEQDVWPGYWQKTLQKVPFGQSALSAEQQRYQQAMLEFTQALLRKESGAAVTQSEYEATHKTYFPQPGDKPETLKQKQRARADVIKNLQGEAGAARPEQAPLSEADVAYYMQTWGKTRQEVLDAVKNAGQR